MGADLAGAMVALFPSRSAAARLAALPVTEEPAERLHLTLVFLGEDAAALGEARRDRVREAVARAASAGRPLRGEVGGIGVFAGDPGSSGRPVVALADVVGLGELRETVMRELGAGNRGPDSHGFTPHITLAYKPSASASRGLRVPPRVPLEFDELVLAWAGEREAFPLGGRTTPKVAAFKRQVRAGVVPPKAGRK